MAGPSHHPHDSADVTSATRKPVSWATSNAIRKTMQACRPCNTGPERALRTRLHALGLRYRVGIRPLPAVRRTADIVFTKVKLAVFVDGCFWHGCPQHGTLPKTHTSYWLPNLARNRERDTETDVALHAARWTVIRVWEHENPDTAAERVMQVYASLKASRCRAQAAGITNERLVRNALEESLS